MIEPAEIEAKAEEFEIHTSDVQRDYVFGWLLFGIFTQSALKDEIFLKGGNALRKGYFPDTRYSADLDFGIPHDIDQEVLRAEINKVCAAVQEKAGVVFVQDDARAWRRSLQPPTRHYPTSRCTRCASILGTSTAALNT